MSNYRIIIEPTTEEAAKKLPEELRAVECSGFVLMADRPGNSTIAIQDIGRMEIASMIGGSPQLLACSHIAKAVQEAKGMERSYSMSEMIKELTDKANRRLEDN